MRSFYLLCEEPSSLTIKGFSDGLSLTQCAYHRSWKALPSWGFVYLHSSYDFIEEDEDNNDPTPLGFILGGVGGQFLLEVHH